MSARTGLPAEIAYSDGVAVETRILELLRSARELGSLQAIESAHYASWPVRYHLCPERANLVRHLDFRGLRVLELGAGMGGVSRYLAEQAASLVVVEGTRARFAALSQRLRDLNNWRGHVANIQDIAGPPDGEPADVVCLIGVLEYSELHVVPPPGSGHTPFSWIIERARESLAPGGVLLLAIENRLGLKYWAGAPEDHTGRIFDGIAGYPAAPSPKTFSRKELVELLSRAGLPCIREYYPFPDYKIPSSVIARELIDADPELAAEIAGTRPFESYGAPRAKLLPELLVLDGLASAGLLPELANSFLLLAARDESPTLSRLAPAAGEVAWHYSLAGSVSTRTVFSRAADGSILVRKEALNGAGSLAAQRGELGWRGSTAAPAARGQSLGRSLLRAAYFGDWPRFSTELLEFLRWSGSHWSGDGHAGRLRGEAVDAIWVNAKTLGAGRFVLFDLEWEWSEPVPLSWFVLRNVHVLDRARDYLAGAPFQSLEELYIELCRGLALEPALELDLRREARFQALALGQDEASTLQALHDLFARPLPTTSFGPSSVSAHAATSGGLGRALGRVKNGIKARPRLYRLANRVRQVWSRR